MATTDQPPEDQRTMTISKLDDKETK